MEWWAGHNWPPARRAYAPEGMLEYWNNGTMGKKTDNINRKESSF
jgi:hypothetical protein